jgi:hypothetical protein
MTAAANWMAARKLRVILSYRVAGFRSSRIEHPGPQDAQLKFADAALIPKRSRSFVRHRL